MSTSTPQAVPSASAAGPAAALSAAAASALLFAIEDLAQLFRLQVDTAHELIYRSDFPQPIKIGRRWLWFPAEVLAWTSEQKRYSASERKRNATEPEGTPEPFAVKKYTPRNNKDRGQAA